MGVTALARFFLPLVLTASLFGPAGAQADPVRSPLRWGADPSGGAPYVFTDPAHPSETIGYEKELVDALAAELGATPELVPTDWETVVPALQRGEFDLLVNGLEPTPDRAREILFSRPYYVFSLGLTVRRDDAGAPRSLADARTRGKVVATLGNTAASRLLEQENVPARAYADPVGAYADLAVGRVDAVLMDKPVETFYALPDARFRPAEEPPTARGVYVVGLRRGDEALRARVDAAIEALRGRGETERILRRWNLWDEHQSALAASGPGDTYGLSTVGRTGGLAWPATLARLARAALVTVGLAFGAMVLAVALGLPVAWAEAGGAGRWGRAVAVAYVEFFRGTPVVVQLLFLYFGLPRLGVTLPGWLTALAGLGLNYAAYESQVYRAAFGSVPRGQWEAASALGLGRVMAFRYVALPQALRVALPAMTNDFVALFKDTSVAFAISVWELATAYRELANASQNFLLLGVVVSGFYLAMSLPLAHFARRLERRLGG